VILLVVVYAVLPLLQAALFIGPRPILDAAGALNDAAAILCYDWMLANVIFGSKIPFLQKHLPYDGRIRFHVISTFGITLTLVYHGIYEFAAGKVIDVVSWSLALVFLTFAALALFWMPVPGFVRLRRWVQAKVSARPKYDTSKAAHGIFVLALTLLLFVHVVPTDFVSGRDAAQTILALAYYAAALFCFVIARTPLLRVTTTVKEALVDDGILQLTLVPTRRLRYRSGQFAFLRSPRIHAAESHPFSFLSSPREPEVRFAIRVRGDYTTALTTLVPGDRVQLRTGFGNLYPGGEPALCFVSTGVGAVPLLSVVRELALKGDKRPIRFFSTVDAERGLPALRQLEELGASLPRFQWTPLEAGDRYDSAFFKANLDQPQDFSYYLCSSDLVQQSVVKALQSLGVRRRAIHQEVFALGPATTQ